MITKRSVFKQPLCLNCSHYNHTVLQGGAIVVRCEYNLRIPLTPNDLATECSMFSDRLKDKYWDEFNKATTEIPIIGQKTVQAGFLKHD